MYREEVKQTDIPGPSPFKASCRGAARRGARWSEWMKKTVMKIHTAVLDNGDVWKGERLSLLLTRLPSSYESRDNNERNFTHNQNNFKNICIGLFVW